MDMAEVVTGNVFHGFPAPRSFLGRRRMYADEICTGHGGVLLGLNCLCKASCNAREGMSPLGTRGARRLPSRLSLQDQNKPVSRERRDFAALNVSVRSIEIAVPEVLPSGESLASCSPSAVIRIDILRGTNKCVSKALMPRPALSGPLEGKACVFWATGLFVPKLKWGDDS